MTVKVIRKKERLTSQWTELEIYLDGERVSTIYGNDTAEFELESGTGELKVKQILSRSVTKQVKSGDVVEVSNSPFVKYTFYMMPVILLVMFTSSYFDLLNFWILTVFVAVFIFFAGSVKPLQIKLINNDEKNGTAI